jgi:hypothetical protein
MNRNRRSDLYAFGVVLWCMWTCSRDPYPHMRHFAHVVR